MLGKTFQNALQNFKKLKIKNLHIGIKHNKIGNYIHTQIRSWDHTYNCKQSIIIVEYFCQHNTGLKFLSIIYLM